MAIEISDEDRKQAIESIREFFANTLDDEIGELKARMVLDFVIEEIGPSIYNRAIGDARRYFAERTEDLSGSCYEPEFPRAGRRPD